MPGSWAAEPILDWRRACSMEWSSSRRRAPLAYCSCQPPTYSRRSAPPHSCRCGNPGPVPIRSHARHGARTHWARTSPPAPSADRPRDSRTGRNWHGFGRCRSPTRTSASSPRAPRTPTPTRSAADTSAPSPRTATARTPAHRSSSRRRPDASPGPSPGHRHDGNILPPDSTRPTARTSPRAPPPRRACLSSPDAPGFSSGPRNGSSAAEPIRYDPAGTTTISGQSAQSRNVDPTGGDDSGCDAPVSRRPDTDRLVRCPVGVLIRLTTSMSPSALTKSCHLPSRRPADR